MLILGAVLLSGFQIEAATNIDSFGQLPLSFQANPGFLDEEVEFLARTPGYTLFLTPSEAVVVLTDNKIGREDRPESKGPAFRVKLMGSNPTPTVEGLGAMPGSINYFIGDDPQSWRTNVPHYSRVQYRGVYSGIDLVYYARDGQVEYDFVVAPTVDAETIVFGIEGGDHVEIDENGDVVITVLGETFRMKKPVVFQEIRGVQEIVAANYFRKDENEFGFLIDRYDSTLPLIIDPVLTYATYLGGSNADTVQEMAVDDAGNAYL